MKMDVYDNGGRRSGIDRRQTLFDGYLPERRSGGDRRLQTDRRSGLDRRSPEGFRAIIGQDRRFAFRNR